MEKRCQEIQEQILDFVSDALPAEEAACVQEHIAKCPACSDYLRQLQADDKLLGDFAEAMQSRVTRLEDNLAEALSTEPSKKAISSIGLWRGPAKSAIAKFAAAAILLIVIGYAVGRISAARAVDAEELRTFLRDEWRHDLRLALADSNARLKDELSEQFHRELNASAVQTLAASGAVTNELLSELVESVSAAQVQQRREIITALGQMEFNRLQDSARFRDDMVNFAVETSDELHRAREDIAEWIAYGRPENSVPEESKD